MDLQKSLLLPPASAVEVIESVLWLCVCVCGPVCLLMCNKTTFGRKECPLGERGRYVNAQAFSFKNLAKISALKRLILCTHCKKNI